MAWDSSFKNMLKQLMGRRGVEVVTEFETPKANLRLDFFIPDSKGKSPFHHCRKVVMGEFKSERDKILPGDIYMLLSKCYSHLAITHGYGNMRSELEPIREEEITALMVLGGGKLSEMVGNFETETLERGVVKVKTGIHVIVIELDNAVFSDELRILKLYASEEVRRDVMKKALLENDKYIMTLSYFLNKEELEKLAEAEGRPLSRESMSIRLAVESIGVERVVDEVGLLRVVDEVGLSRVVDEVGLSRVIDEVGLSRVIDEVGVERILDELPRKKILEKLGPHATIKLILEEADEKTKEELKELFEQS